MGQADPLADGADLGRGADEQAWQHLILGHQQQATEQDVVAGGPGQLRPGPPGQRLRGRRGHTRQQALRDLALRVPGHPPARACSQARAGS